MPFAFARECRRARPALGRSDSGAACRFGVLAESDLEAARHGPGGSADRRGSPPRAPGKMIPCHGIHILHARRRDRRAGEVGAARRRVGAERPRHAGREETAHGRCRWHVPRAVSGFSVSLKINIVAPAESPSKSPVATRHARAGSRRRKERRGRRGAWARRGTRGLQRTRPMRKTDLPATGR